MKIALLKTIFFIVFTSLNAIFLIFHPAFFSGRVLSKLWLLYAALLCSSAVFIKVPSDIHASLAEHVSSASYLEKIVKVFYFMVSIGLLLLVVFF